MKKGRQVLISSRQNFEGLLTRGMFFGDSPGQVYLDQFDLALAAQTPQLGAKCGSLTRRALPPCRERWRRQTLGCVDSLAFRHLPSREVARGNLAQLYCCAMMV